MKKIMFNDRFGLTKAVLEGRKTMTRRMVSVPEYWHGMWVWGFSFDEQSHSLLLYDADEGLMEDPNTGECAYILPKYKIGEVVAVAQCYEDAILDVGEEKWNKIHKWYNIHYLCHEKGLHNKMFVRADLMPHKIRITDIKVERLQDISDEDCIKEGIWIDSHREVLDDNIYTLDVMGKHYCQWHFPSPKLAFATLIDKVSGKGTWGSNPYVFAYTFEIEKQ